MAKRPHSETGLAKFLRKRVLELRPTKSQIQIASEAGFVNPTKLPLDRVSGLAKALDSDPKLLFKLALEQAGDETTARAVAEIFGTVVTRNEVAWLEEIREASCHSDPSLTARSRTALRGVFGK